MHQSHVRAGVYGRQSQGNKKSIKDQIDEGTAVVREHGWTLVDTYSDKVSASRYGRKVRDDWQRALDDIAAGALDVLVLWESSRGDRKLTSWSALLDLCRELRVGIHITQHERTYDLTRARDWESLATDGVKSEGEVNLLSARVRRGVASSAKAGRPPAGRPAYGYRRVYDQTTGELTGQEPDPVTAPIATEIITRIAAMEPVSAVVKDLNARGVPVPFGGQKWRRQPVRDFATNPAYIGLRRHKDQTYPAGWAPIVEEAVWYAAGRVLQESTRVVARVRPRPGRQLHLLSYLATCKAGCSMSARDEHYTCSAGHVYIRREMVDTFVTEMVIARLGQPDVYRNLRKGGEEADRKAMVAQNKAAQLRDQLDKWRLSAATGKTTPESLAVIETSLMQQITEADVQAMMAGAPPALREALTPGQDVRDRWEAITLPAKRAIIRTLAEVVLSSVGKQGKGVAVQERLAGSRWVGDELTWSDHWSKE